MADITYIPACEKKNENKGEIKMSEKFVAYTMDDALTAVADLKEYC